MMDGDTLLEAYRELIVAAICQDKGMRKGICGEAVSELAGLFGDGPDLADALEDLATAARAMEDPEWFTERIVAILSKVGSVTADPEQCARMVDALRDGDWGKPMAIDPFGPVPDRELPRAQRAALEATPVNVIMPALAVVAGEGAAAVRAGDQTDLSVVLAVAGLAVLAIAGPDVRFARKMRDAGRVPETEQAIEWTARATELEQNGVRNRWKVIAEEASRKGQYVTPDQVRKRVERYTAENHSDI